MKMLGPFLAFIIISLAVFPLSVIGESSRDYLKGVDYGLPGYFCAESIDSVGWMAMDGTSTHSWTPESGCPEYASDCQLASISIKRRYLLIGIGPGSGSFRIQGPSGEWYYSSYIEDIASCPNYDIDAGGIMPNGYVYYEACDSKFPNDGILGTDGLAGKGFVPGSYNVEVFAGNGVLTDIFDIAYTWCWKKSQGKQ